MKNILVAVRDAELRAAVRRNLNAAGYVVQCAKDGAAACDSALRDDHAAIILDADLSVFDAWSICAKLRSSRVTTPVLMLTSAECVRERIAGLECGADDCLEKPFEFEELHARLKALIRRDRVVRSSRIVVDDLVVDCAARTASRAGREVRLAQREFTLLEALALNEGKVVTRTAIQLEVWGDGFSSSNTVDVHVRNLRRKIDNGEPRLIHTVFGVGYILRSVCAQEEATPADSDESPE
jgi:DNA-binding response OmpR family regulator